MSKQSGLIIAWYKKGINTFFLIGQESAYSEYIPLPTTGMEGIHIPKNARYVIRKQLKTGAVSYTVQRTVGKPEKTTTNTGFSTVVNPATKWGFPKGGKKEVDTTVVDTAVREFEEEVGYILEKDKLQPLFKIESTQVYGYECTEEEVASIKKAADTMEKEQRGELFHVDFLAVNSIMRKIENNRLNAVTERAFREFMNLFFTNV